VRIVAVHDKAVVVDTNPRWAGRAPELEVKLLGIEAPATGADSPPV
jgi:FKBP-type peptidyl-prolyl cis-trans isomerase 2